MRQENEKNSSESPQSGAPDAQAQRRTEIEKGIRGRQLELFFTTLGPIIGYSGHLGESRDQFRIRVWAPAILQVATAPNAAGTGLTQRVVFQPLTFIETYVDLSTATPAGKAPVPDSVKEGYKLYLERFMNGAYQLQQKLVEVNGEDGDPAVSLVDPADVPAAEGPSS